MTTGYEIMKQYLGLQEHRDKDKLMALFKSEGIMNPEYPNEVFDPDGLDKHGLPWCAVMVSYCEKVARAPIAIQTRYAAREFLNYGIYVGESEKDLKNAKEGDIIIFERGNNSYQGHVAYFVEMKNGFVRHIGGNQSDAVSYAFTQPNRVIGIRRIV